MHILLILLKNSSVLDYALPVLHRLRQEHPEARISILCTALNHTQIIRQCQFVDAILKDDRIEIFDLTSFMDNYSDWIKGCIRWAFRFTNWDRLPMHHRLKRIPIGFVRQKVSNLYHEWSKRLPKKVSGLDILQRLKPTLIIYDHRSNSALYGKVVTEFHQYFETTKVPVVLSPHAPHQIDLDRFVPFSKTGNGLPAYCDYWMSFIHDEHWKSAPETKSQMHYIGFPGMDSQWLSYCKPRGPLTCRAKRAPNELTCLFVIRRFLNRDEPDWPDFPQHYIFNHIEFLAIAQAVAKALRELGRPVHLLVKPHPSNDFGRVEEMMRIVGMRNYSITTEPIYGVLNRIDFVLSVYSTIFFVPSVMGIPVAMLNTRVQQDVHAQSEVMKKLYENFHYYVEDNSQLGEVMQRIVTRLDGPAISLADDPDVQHMRHYYPDGAIDRAMGRIHALHKSSKPTVEPATPL